MDNSVSLSVPSPAATADPRPRDLAGAARQFEALLLAQLLKAACEPETMTGGEPDAAACTAIQMAQEQFASALASQGGLGLARMIETSSASARPSPAGAPEPS